MCTGTLLPASFFGAIGTSLVQSRICFGICLRSCRNVQLRQFWLNYGLNFTVSYMIFVFIHSFIHSFIPFPTGRGDGRHVPSGAPSRYRSIGNHPGSGGYCHGLSASCGARSGQ